MAVDILVVVAKGECSELACETAAAGVVLAAVAPAVPAPVAQGKYDFVQ